MYMLWVYVNKKPYDSMGIKKNTLDEIYAELTRISKEILAENPRAEVGSRVVVWA